MKRYNPVLIFASAALLMASCVRDSVDFIKIDDNDNKTRNTVTFVVSVPSGAGNSAGEGTRSGVASKDLGGNGHFGDNLPRDYRNYLADADTETYGTNYGGYPDPDSETAAFDKAIEAMADNFASGGGGKGTRAGNPATRNIYEGDGNEIDDNFVEEIDIMLFDRNTGLYVDRIEVPATEINYNEHGDYTLIRITLTLPDSNYKAVFLANVKDHLDTYIAQAGSGINTLTVAELRQELSIPFSAPWETDTENGGYVPFPMSSQEVDFVVPATRDYETYPVDLTRGLAKINVSLGNDVEATINEIYICNYETGIRVLPGENWRQGMSPLTDDADALNPYGIRSNPASHIVYNTLGTKKYVDEIFVPEQAHITDEADAQAQAFCLVMKLNTGDGEKWYRIDLAKKADTPTGLEHTIDLIRNFRYDINIVSIDLAMGYETLEGALQNLPVGTVVEINATDDVGVNDVTYNGRYQLAVDRSVVILGADAGSIAHQRVYTDFMNGWKSSGLPNNFYNGFTVTMTPSSTTSANGVSATDVVFKAVTENTTGRIREKTLVYTAGGLRKEIWLVQLPHAKDADFDFGVAPNGVNFYKYVGAFWQAHQTGERLIRVQIDESHSRFPQVAGKWAAFVLDGADWVVLDTKPSTDANLGWLAGADDTGMDYGNDPGFDESHPVTGSASWISGVIDAENPGLYFRIGLKNKHIVTDSEPARYARVLLLYNKRPSTGNTMGFNFQQTLFLRQGQDPDYIMRPGDDVMGGVITERTAAVKFSPYNLTAETLSNGTSVNAPVNRMDNPTGPNPPRFTDYPSQAGAFFQYHTTHGGPVERYAWDVRTSSFPQSLWSTTATQAQLWSDIYEDNETCPQGYALSTGRTVDFRRPTDGPTDLFSDMTSANDVQLSEMRQSLYKYILAGTANSLSELMAASLTPSDRLDHRMVTGYYADGFFDRRAIGTSLAGRTVVSAGNDDIAYRGALIYNRETGAHIFMPYSGYRTNIDGRLQDSGTMVSYSSSSVFSENIKSIWALDLSGYNDSSYATTRTSSQTARNGYSIRCVVAPPPPTPQVTGLVFNMLDMYFAENGDHIASSNYLGTGDMAEVTITGTNIDGVSWTVEFDNPSDASWVHLYDDNYQELGDVYGDGTVRFGVEPNPYNYPNNPQGGQYRKAKVVLKAGDFVGEELTIHQLPETTLGTPSLNGGTDVVLNADGDMADQDYLADWGNNIMIDTNTTFVTVSLLDEFSNEVSYLDWISVSYDYGSNILQIDCTENDTPDTRLCYIVVTAQNSIYNDPSENYGLEKSVTFTVTQNP